MWFVVGRKACWVWCSYCWMYAAEALGHEPDFEQLQLEHYLPGTKRVCKRTMHGDEPETKHVPVRLPSVQQVLDMCHDMHQM